MTHNIVEISIYMNCHDMFIIIITWTWHNMNYHYLTIWCCLKITNNLKITKKMSLKMTSSNNFLKYVRYELNCSTCSHENEIMKYLLSWWKILRKLSNQNHMLIHIFLYLKNITIWLMFLRDKKLTNWHHIKKNMISELIWNQKKFQVLNFCMICHEMNCRYYDNTWISILQKILFDQAVFHLCFWYCLQRNWMKNYDFALIIEFWMWSWFEIDIQFSWFKKC